MDGDNRQQEHDERRKREEEAINAYADGMIRRDLEARHIGHGTHDTAPDGRPLYVGAMAYETWVKTDRRSTTEKERK